MALLRSLSLDEKGGPSLVFPDLDAAQAEDEGVRASAMGRAKELHKPEPEEEQGAYLPDECVKLIQTHLIAGEPLGIALLHLLSMASVCRQWRGLASELAQGSSIAFDCFDNAFPTQPSVQKFRKLSSAQKEVVFSGAARLFNGYSDVSLSGDGVSDRVLQELATRNGAKLTKCKVVATSAVTDAGLCALADTAKQLHTLEVSGLSKPIAGKFLPKLFENCDELQALHLSNMPNLNWAPCKAAAEKWRTKHITKFTARGVNTDNDFGQILTHFPLLQELEVDGSPKILKHAATACPELTRVSYTLSQRPQLDEALQALMLMPNLRQLELVIKNIQLCPNQLRIIGMLPLVELRLDSFVHKQQPTLSRTSYSHVDNEGVKALVDSICNRWCSIGPGEMQPLKLSLCGASALTHDAVSALLRLPILTELDIGGCARIIAMDKMRLVAKVRAGRELLDSGRRPTMRQSRFPGLLI